MRNDWSRLRTGGRLVALLASTAGLAAASAQPVPLPAPSPPATMQSDWRETWAYAVGFQAVVYGYPVVKNLTARYQMIERPNGQADMPLHTWFHSRRASDATDKVHSSVTPDLLYSAAWFDLRQGPVILTVPDSPRHYYSIQFMEMYSDIFAYLGTRATGGRAGTHMLVGPEWQGETPPGIDSVIRSPTPTGLLLLRVALTDREDLQSVHRVQDGVQIATLAKWRAGDASPETQRDVLDPVAPGASPLPFFAMLNRGMTENPPPARDAELLAQFRTIGIGPGRSDDFSGMDPATLRGLQRAMTDGLAFLRQVAVSGGNARKVNHWAYGQTNWGRTAETSDFLTRSANQSFSGMQEHWIEEVVKLRAHHDSDGEPLDGSKARYTITFAPGQIPEAHSFWSVTLYDSDYDLVANPIGRYSRGSVDRRMRYGRDGSLTLYLQPDPPSRDKLENWLPTPRGAFNLFMRAYLPGEALIRQDYVPPPVRKAP